MNVRVQCIALLISILSGTCIYSSDFKSFYETFMVQSALQESDITEERFGRFCNWYQGLLHKHKEQEIIKEQHVLFTCLEYRSPDEMRFFCLFCSSVAAMHDNNIELIKNNQFLCRKKNKDKK